MPAKAKEMTALAVGRLREPGRYAVGGADGLHLRIVGGSRAWVLRAMVADRRRDIGLGPYPEVTLAEARDLALDFRRQIRRGVDLVQEREIARQDMRVRKAELSFKACGEAYVEAHRSGWKNAKHVAQWSSTLETYAYPEFGDRPVSKIDTAALLAILKPIWTTKTETASRLRGRIENILDWAKVQGLREGDNPAQWRGHLDKLLPARRRVQSVKHHEALPYAEIAAFMQDLRSRSGTSARALEFGILCASRSGEVRGATWDEIDVANGVWIIPAERMKAAREHRIPLSSAALALLEALPRFKGEAHLFPAPRGGELSNMSLTAVLKRMGHPTLTQHGFRSTFRDWAGEMTSHPREVIEHALAHLLKDKSEAAYQRGDLLAKRRLLMNDWATFCDRSPQNSTVTRTGP